MNTESKFWNGVINIGIVLMIVLTLGMIFKVGGFGANLSVLETTFVSIISIFVSGSAISSQLNR